ncbi:hypothetical protein CH373_06430 [Leptospira perolatii]|uniref:Yip1 domain-containing protein n=1 Tax=Leptospira perolatii TaxID=2023191 RepID=A0A2M9ZPD8_9LEPT|nr:hypothetical protein [Leptospira perolatii]PJZ70897.1 hypothetical protein CH360_05160 [Leptospira perolatii]PJZ73793.1 hypothetical protein CH373_06430 [Leptospira perolatii]
MPFYRAVTVSDKLKMVGSVSEYFRESWRFLRDPKNFLRTQLPKQGLKKVIFRTYLFFLIGVCISILFRAIPTFAFAAALGMSFDILVLSLEYILLFFTLPLLYGAIFLSAVGGGLFLFANLTGGKADFLSALASASFLSFLYIPFAISSLFSPYGLSQTLIQAICLGALIYFSILCLFHVYHGDRNRVLIVGGLLALICVLYLYFSKSAEIFVDNQYSPMSPEEEQEKIKEAEEFMEKMEQLRREKGLAE